MFCYQGFAYDGGFAPEWALEDGYVGLFAADLGSAAAERYEGRETLSCLG